LTTSPPTRADAIVGCIFQVEDKKWLCTEHMNERINSPKNLALTQADNDLAEFLDEGGKVS
jgi:hypothetical protein